PLRASISGASAARRAMPTGRAAVSAGASAASGTKPVAVSPRRAGKAGRRAAEGVLGGIVALTGPGRREVPPTPLGTPWRMVSGKQAACFLEQIISNVCSTFKRFLPAGAKKSILAWSIDDANVCDRDDRRNGAQRAGPWGVSPVP